MENFYNSLAVFLTIGVDLSRDKKIKATELIQVIDAELEGLN